MRNLLGQQIGPYKIEQLIGAGGMADVYRAHQANLDRYVAIKVLKASLADDPEFVARFSREAMASGGLRHPNILRIYDAGTFEDRHYIVMDFANGGTLAERADKQPLSIDEAAELGMQIADALDYAHKRPHPIIHRDLKPSNILLDDDRPLLADFGIAYMVSTEKRLTQTGASLGTPEYMSPEQSEGFPVDGRTDVYSLGVILFQLVTGRVPFQAKTPIATMHEVVYSPPPVPRQFRSDVPEWMESIILRALAKRPQDRFATAGEMADALRQRQVVPVAAGSVDEAPNVTQVAPRVKRPPPTPVKVERPHDTGRVDQAAGPSRFPWVALLALVVFAVVGVGAFLAMPALRGRSDGGQTVAQSAPLPVAPAALPVAPAALPVAAVVSPTRPFAAANAIATPAGLPSVEPAAAVSPSPTAQAATATPALPPTNTALPPTSTALPPTNTPLPPTSTPVPPTSTPVRLSVSPTSPPAYAAAPTAPGIVLDFETPRTWQVGQQKYGTLTQSTEQVHSGKFAAKLAYDFPAVADEYVVFLDRTATAIPGKPAALTAWVYGDGSGHYLNVWVKDSAGQVRQFSFGRVSHLGWQQMTAPLDTSAPWPQGNISGTDNPQLVYPLSLNALVLDAVPHGTASTGSIFLDDIAVAAGAAGQGYSGGAPTPAAPAVAAAPSALAGHIVFPQLENGHVNIMALDAATAAARLVVPHGDQPAIRGGGRIVFNGQGGGKDNLNAVNLDGSGFMAMSNRVEDAYPSWSPDGGSTVIFHSSSVGGENRLYTLPDSARNQLPAPVLYGGQGLLGQFPTWLSNGRMAYSGCGYQWGNGQLCGIWSINGDGSDPQRLTDIATDRPTDSRGGRLLFNRQAGGATDVFVISDNGGPALNLTNSPGEDFGASFAPDRRSIAFISNRDGWSIWVMNADGSGQRQLAAVPAGFGPQWQDERLSWGP